MTGTWLRGPTFTPPPSAPHTCKLPFGGVDLPRVEPGAVWRCDCGRRWTRTRLHGWRRRRRPWPRRTAEERRQADERRQEEAIDRALAAGRPLPKGMIKDLAFAMGTLGVTTSDPDPTTREP